MMPVAAAIRGAYHSRPIRSDWQRALTSDNVRSAVFCSLPGTYSII